MSSSFVSKNELQEELQSLRIKVITLSKLIDKYVEENPSSKSNNLINYKTADKQITNDHIENEYDYHEESYQDKQKKIDDQIQNLKKQNQQLRNQIRNIQNKIGDTKFELDNLKEQFYQSQRLRVSAADLISKSESPEIL